MPRIIIADDDPLIVELARAALEARGHTVGALPDGRLVKSVAEMKRPDLIVLDCAMPGLSGIEALRQLRSSATAYRTPVVMLTARGSTADERIAYSAGADDYIRKPFCPDELVARVEALVGPAAIASAA